MFRGGPARCGFFGSVDVVPPHASAPWAFPTGGPIKAAPAVADGVVYVTSLDGGLYAVDAASGELRWRFMVPGGVDSSPAVADGLVYFSGDKHLWAVEVATGRERWRLPTGALLGSSPAVAGGRVFVGAGDCRMIAVDARSGERRWEFASGGYRVLPTLPPRPEGIQSSAAVCEGAVYFVGADQNVYALSAASGARRWSAPMGCHNAASVAVAGGTVYGASFDGNVFALDASTGKPRWQQRVETTFAYCVPAVADGRVYLAGRAKAAAAKYRLSVLGDLYALDAATGHPRWHLPTDSWVEAAPAVSGGCVYLATRGSSVSSATLSAFEASTGATRWQREINFRWAGGGLPMDGVRSSPTVADSMVYMGNPNGRLYAYRADTGAGVDQREAAVQQPMDSKSYVLQGCALMVIGAFSMISGLPTWLGLGTLAVGAVSCLYGAIHGVRGQ